MIDDDNVDDIVRDDDWYRLVGKMMSIHSHLLMMEW